MKDDLFEMFASICRPMQEMTLASIQLSKPVMTAEKVTHFIREGDKVLIKDNELVYCIGEASHQITQCRGTATSDFSINVINLKTRELINVKL